MSFIGLAVHCRQRFRWIPSKRNSADAPSRVFDCGKVEDKSKVCFHYQNVNTDQILQTSSHHPTSDAYQSYMSRLSVAPSCSRPLPTEASSVRRHEEAAGGRLNTTENAVPLIQVSPTRGRRLRTGSRSPLTMSSCTRFLQRSSDKPIRGSGGVPRLQRIEPKKHSTPGFWGRMAQTTTRGAQTTTARRVGPPI